MLHLSKAKSLAKKKFKDVAVTSSCDPNDLRQYHLSLKLEADFERHIFVGCATLSFVIHREGLKSFVLDTSSSLLVRSVHQVKVKTSKKKKRIKKIKQVALLSFALHAEEQPFGAPLMIFLDESPPVGSCFHIQIHYQTSPSASGLQWLDPQHTDGKKHPYVFSQFQAIHARSFVPIQDCPGLKFTYDAVIKCPEPLTALMSALSVGHDDAGFHFWQQVPVSSYLIAVVIGELASKRIGRISHVWTEPCRLDAAAREFSNVDTFLDAANRVTGIDYLDLGWGKFDLLVLPASFPYGGMENPTLTFVTPTLLTESSDQSLTDVIAHELAHSWFGNYVSCMTWEHFWLNEGFTVWLERRILEVVRGSSAARDAAVYDGNVALLDVQSRFQENCSALALITDLSLTDPDDYFSRVPYEKGSQFLYYLEKEVLRQFPSLFDECVTAWLQKYKYSAATSEQWRKFFTSYFKKYAIVKPLLKQINWNVWFNEPGMPPVDVAAMLDLSQVRASSELARSWIAGGSGDACAMDGWDTASTLRFLDEFTADFPVDVATWNDIVKTYKLDQTTNAEIIFRRLLVSATLGDIECFEDVGKMLRSQGRMKYCRPLYRALLKSEQGTVFAKELFAECGCNYNPIAFKMLKKDLAIDN